MDELYTLGADGTAVNLADLLDENTQLRQKNKELLEDIAKAAAFGLKMSLLLGENALTKLPGIALKLASNPAGFSKELGLDELAPLIDKYAHLVNPA